MSPHGQRERLFLGLKEKINLLSAMNREKTVYLGMGSLKCCKDSVAVLVAAPIEHEDQVGFQALRRDS